MVVWRSGAEVLFQRFSASDAPVSGDQETTLATTSAGTRGAPTVTTGGTFFLAAWESGAEVRARLLGVDGGFQFNPVSGQNDDFVATAGATTPKAPAVAVGAGAMAIGWQEEGGSAAGIYVRRFPLPTP
jgi:hypothetical protein